MLYMLMSDNPLNHNVHVKKVMVEAYPEYTETFLCEIPSIFGAPTVWVM